jgi:hypothetical protein
MSDTTTTDQTEQRDADQTDQTTTDQQTDQTEDLGDRGQAALKAERDARKKAERDLKALNTRLAELENAGKSESEQIAARLKAAEERATAAELRLRATAGQAVTAELASKHGAISTRAVYALIRDDIDYDDDGEPTNIADLIGKAKKDEPQLFRAAAGSGDGGKRGPITEPDDMNARIRRMAGRT